MADNFDFTPGSGGTGAADLIDSVYYPRIKLIHGADGVNDGDVSNANPLPVKFLSSGLATDPNKIEDTASASGDVATAILAVRNDSNAALSDTDGDYTMINVDSAGRLKIVVSTALPAGTNGIGKLTANGGVIIGDVNLVSSIPAGANSIGTVILGAGAAAIGSVTLGAAIPAGANSIGTVVLGAGAAAIGKLTANSGVIIGDVNLVSAIPAGTNAIGKLTANSGVIIGDVNVVSLIPGVTATSLGKAEDAAHVSGDTGVMALAVRQDTIAALAGSDGDYIPLTTDAKGSLNVVAGGYLKIGAVSKTRPSDTTTYASGDVLSESTSAGTMFTFTNAARVSGGSGVISEVLIDDSAFVVPALQSELWLFDTVITSNLNDNVAFAPTDAEMQTLQAVIPIGTTYVGNATAGTGGNAFITSGPVNIPYKCVGTSLFGMLVVRNTYVPISAEIINVRVKLSQD